MLCSASWLARPTLFNELSKGTMDVFGCKDRQGQGRHEQAGDGRQQAGNDRGHHGTDVESSVLRSRGYYPHRHPDGVCGGRRILKSRWLFFSCGWPWLAHPAAWGSLVSSSSKLLVGGWQLGVFSFRSFTVEIAVAHGNGNGSGLRFGYTVVLPLPGPVCLLLGGGSSWPGISLSLCLVWRRGRRASRLSAGTVSLRGWSACSMRRGQGAGA